MQNDQIANLARAAAARKRAAAAEAKLADATEKAIRDARAANVSWAQISEKLGISEGQAKWLVQRHTTPEALARQEGQIPRTAPRPGRGPGVGVTEASRLLGVTRRTIYLWCHDGKLMSARNEQGKVRVLVEKVEVIIPGPGVIPEDLDPIREVLEVHAIDAPGARMRYTAQSDLGPFVASIVTDVDPNVQNRTGSARIAAAMIAAGITISIATTRHPAVSQIIAHIAAV